MMYGASLLNHIKYFDGRAGVLLAGFTSECAGKCFACRVNISVPDYFLWWFGEFALNFVTESFRGIETKILEVYMRDSLLMIFFFVLYLNVGCGGSTVLVV